MAKLKWKPGNMVYPLPAVLVSCGDKEGHVNLMTAAWTGTICSDPPMVYVSIRKERYSHPMIQETGEYVINLTTEELAWATDFCGVRSGRNMDKFKEMKLTPVFGELQYAPTFKWPFRLGLACCIGILICLKYMGKRSDYGTKIYGRVLGFKNLI